jgi:hypothetical protein
MTNLKNPIGMQPTIIKLLIYFKVSSSKINKQLSYWVKLALVFLQLKHIQYVYNINNKFSKRKNKLLYLLSMPNKMEPRGKIKGPNKILMKSKDRTCSNHLFINSSIDSTSNTQNSTKII